MDNLQKEFFESLSNVQDIMVNIMLCKIEKYDKMEDILVDITYETIYKIMEVIDGYQKKDLKLDIIDRETKQSIRNGKDLHNICADFLKCSDI